MMDTSIDNTMEEENLARALSLSQFPGLGEYNAVAETNAPPTVLEEGAPRTEGAGGESNAATNTDAPSEEEEEDVDLLRAMQLSMAANSDADSPSEEGAQKPTETDKPGENSSAGTDDDVPPEPDLLRAMQLSMEANADADSPSEEGAQKPTETDKPGENSSAETDGDVPPEPDSEPLDPEVLRAMQLSLAANSDADSPSEEGAQKPTETDKPGENSSAGTDGDVPPEPDSEPLDAEVQRAMQLSMAEANAAQKASDVEDAELQRAMQLSMAEANAAKKDSDEEEVDAELRAALAMSMSAPPTKPAGPPLTLEGIKRAYGKLTKEMSSSGRLEDGDKAQLDNLFETLDEYCREARGRLVKAVMSLSGGIIFPKPKPEPEAKEEEKEETEDTESKSEPKDSSAPPASETVPVEEDI